MKDRIVFIHLLRELEKSHKKINIQIYGTIELPITYQQRD